MLGIQEEGEGEKEGVGKEREGCDLPQMKSWKGVLTRLCSERNAHSITWI
jgi:hypothetical protein